MRHMYFNGTWNWKEWDPDARYIVFDDCSFPHFGPYYKQFFGAQREFTINPKYGKRRTVVWGKPCFWVCNRDGDPRRTFRDGPEYDWLSLNCVFIEVFNPLF